MHTYTDKTQEEKSRSNSIANSHLQSHRRPAFQFVDNRPSAIAQKNLQRKVNNSLQTKKLRTLQEQVNNTQQSNHVSTIQPQVANRSIQSEGPIQMILEPLSNEDIEANSSMHEAMKEVEIYNSIEIDQYQSRLDSLRKIRGLVESWIGAYEVKTF